jgi:hypothetical protein
MKQKFYASYNDLIKAELKGKAAKIAKEIVEQFRSAIQAHEQIEKLLRDENAKLRAKIEKLKVKEAYSDEPLGLGSLGRDNES